MAQESQMMDAVRSSLQKASLAMHAPLLRVLVLLVVSKSIGTPYELLLFSVRVRVQILAAPMSDDILMLKCKDEI